MGAQRLVLVRTHLEPGTKVSLPANIRAIWVVEGAPSVNGLVVGARSGVFCKSDCEIDAAGQSATLLRFEVLSGETPDHGDVLLDEEIAFDPEVSLLRLDTVTFPPGATAYRHVHNGAGPRYLFQGELEVISDHGSETMTNGSAWYEALNSPVTAQAASETTTAFVRCMIIPHEYAGKSTFKLMNEADADKPRRQATHRYFDAPIA